MTATPAPPSSSPEQGSPGAAPGGAQPAALHAHLRRAARAHEAPWLHQEVARRMAQRLDVVRLRPGAVIDWWAALGGAGGDLRERYPAARFEAVEPTEALVQRTALAARKPWWSPARWRSGPPAVWREDSVPIEARAQLVWSNMMLHWAAEPRDVFARWQRLLTVDGFVMFSCFGPDTLRELHVLYRRLGEPPPGHAFIDMHDLGDAMISAGFADPVMDMETVRLTWADAPRALAELRTLGGNAAWQRAAGLRTPRRQQRLLAEIESTLTGQDGRLGLGFEIVYGHGFKPPPKLRVAPETRVPIDTLRSMARGKAGPSARG